jgi:putative oxidoreductase
MFRRLQGFAPEILGIIRMLTGTLIACHGAQKILGVFGGMPPGVPPFIRWVAGGIELGGGALIAVGLFTRPVAFLMSGLMAFAYFMGHAPSGFWPILNHGELAIVFCWLSLYLAAQGPGKWAIDNVLTPRAAGGVADAPATARG